MKILWIKADLLYPLDSGGRIRTFQMLKELNSKHEITYLALSPTSDAELAKDHAINYSSRQVWVDSETQAKSGLRFYAALLKNLIFSDLPYVIEKYKSESAIRSIADVESKSRFDLVVSDFLSMSTNIIDAGISPDKLLVFQHNVESQIWKRQFETASNRIVKAYMYIQWKRYDRFEREMCARFKGVVAVSEDDAVRFANEFHLKNVLGYVPTGVDLEYFSDAFRSPESGHLVFLGSMDWRPNVEGIIEFVASVYPLVKAAYPSARLTIIGRNPSHSVIQLQAADSSISVTGTVEDVRPYLGRGAVSVVPLRVGGGTRIKIFESMAMGLPVVSTTTGAEGLPVIDGVNICIADDPVTFANQIVRLLNDQTYSSSIGESGKMMVAENFSWRNAADKFEAFCAEVAQ
jgi:glycosyltransferase involved in cell wall biosynthesis